MTTTSAVSALLSCSVSQRLFSSVLNRSICDLLVPTLALRFVSVWRYL